LKVDQTSHRHIFSQAMQNSQSTQYIGTVRERKRAAPIAASFGYSIEIYPKNRFRNHSNWVDSAYFPAITSAIKFGEVSLYGRAGEGV
jgi:hypothetical protein